MYDLSRLASLGSRVGLSGEGPLSSDSGRTSETQQSEPRAATVFFSTAVTVIDGAESPFNFVSTPTAKFTDLTDQEKWEVAAYRMCTSGRVPGRNSAARVRQRAPLEMLVFLSLLNLE